MNIGMLWFDNDPKSGLTSKIERAAIYYRQKYGKTPNLCFIHPSMVIETNPSGITPKAKDDPIEVRTSRIVLPNYFWIGVNSPLGEA